MGRAPGGVLALSGCGRREHEIVQRGPFRAIICIRCAVCTGSCCNTKGKGRIACRPNSVIELNGRLYLPMSLKKYDPKGDE
eukprot:4048843-Pyramimonas_sp.AAC.1